MMRNKKAILLLLPVVLALAALYPALSRHPVHLFLLKGTEGTVEAYKLSLPLNGQEAAVESIPLNPSQQKAGGEILALKDSQRLGAFARDLGVFAGVVGVPSTQDGWPGFLGGGCKGVLSDSLPGSFDNLQWTDRRYLAF